jgi:protein disulfide-isomerase
MLSMKLHAPLFALLLSLVGGSLAFAAKPGWTENFAEAQTQAASQKKHVLLDFTGSDWCGWCIKLDKEVFAKPEFKELGEKSLVLVELDFPKAKPQTPAVKAQNEGLGRKFKVNGYPTLVLLDASGKEVKRWEGFDATFLADLKKAVGSK